MWSTARLTTYIGGFLIGLVFILDALGAGVYDKAAGTFDPHPFNVWWLSGIIAGPVASGIAAVALALGWGKR